jgi:hypothetical protein
MWLILGIYYPSVFLTLIVHIYSSCMLTNVEWGTTGALKKAAYKLETATFRMVAIQPNGT